MRRPGSAIVEGEIVVEQLGCREHAGGELFLCVAPHQACQVHDLVLIAALVRLEFHAHRGQHVLHLPGVVLPVIIEQAVEHPAQFDLLFLSELVAGAHQAVPRQAQFSMRIDEVLEDIRYVPGYAQPHFHFAGHPLELLLEGVLISDQDSADGLRAGGNGAEGHRQRGCVGHQTLEHRLVGREVGAFRPDLRTSQAADDRGHAAVGNGVHILPLDAQRSDRSVVRRPPRWRRYSSFRSPQALPAPDPGR